MNELTKAEVQVMHYLWELEKSFLKDIVEAFPEPRPAYTTISTVIRVLVKKGYVGFNTYGKVHEYFPKTSRKAYFQKHVKSIINMHFDGSVVSFASFFTGDEALDLGELEEIKMLIDQKIEDLKGGRQ
ncbi:MAG: BlaI/MecI/CopY family transcriptional regulator [Bacteroidia bacterium]|nr:MAG: BlaI/MecI/CopY family transcriptional regulator [Bacteroidia bacterium]